MQETRKLKQVSFRHLLASGIIKHFNKEIFSYLGKTHRQRQTTKPNPPKPGYIPDCQELCCDTLTHLDSKNSQKVSSEFRKNITHVSYKSFKMSFPSQVINHTLS